MAKHHFKYYLHDNYEFGEILETLGDQLVPEDILEDVATSVRHQFYEIAFDCTYDEETKALTVNMS